MRLQEAEARINAAVPVQDAEEMAHRYAEAAAAGARGAGHGGRRAGAEGSGEPSDEEIARIVEVQRETAGVMFSFHIPRSSLASRVSSIVLHFLLRRTGR